MKDQPSINCKEASYLITKQQEVPITPQELEQVKAHLAICPTCTLFNEQTRLLVDILRKKKSLTNESEKLSVEARARIEKKLGME